MCWQVSIQPEIRAKIADVTSSHSKFRSLVGYRTGPTPDLSWKAGWLPLADALLALIEDCAPREPTTKGGAPARPLLHGPLNLHTAFVGLLCVALGWAFLDLLSRGIAVTYVSLSSYVH